MEGLLIFIAFVVISNILDKKKPTAPHIPMPNDTEEGMDKIAAEKQQETLKQHQDRLKDILKEKFKPKKPRQTVPLPMNDDKGEPEDDVYTTDANEVINKYQQYADSHDKADETAYVDKCEQPYDLSHKQHAHANKGNGLPGGNQISVAQAIVLGEILGPPRAKKQLRRRF